MADKINLSAKIANMKEGILFKKEDMQAINQAADSLEYLENQNKLLKTKLKQLTEKYKDLEHEYDKVWEENTNLRLVRGTGKVF